MNGSRIGTGSAGDRPLSVCVFSGARSGNSPRTIAAATELGSMLGGRGHRLVYGAGGSGLMGIVAWAAHRSGSDVVGVIPHFLYAKERVREAPPQRLYLTDTMSERKQKMFAMADAFVALPGGYGTLDEVVEVLSLAYLRVQTKPLLLVDVGGLWRGFLRVLTDMQRRGFADPGSQHICRLVGSPAEAIELLDGVRPDTRLDTDGDGRFELITVDSDRNRVGGCPRRS